MNDIGGVCAAGLCSGCGICAFVSEGQIEIVDIEEDGRRPSFTTREISHATMEACMSACPGVSLEHGQEDGNLRDGVTRDPAWGPVLRVWEGHATDTEIRFSASSGGATTGLAAFGLEAGGMVGVLHTAAREDIPYLNHTVLSRSRKDLLKTCGSRYAPASPCDGLQEVIAAPGPCVFIGKPCDVAAVQKTRRFRHDLDSRIGLTIAFFCAGTPSTKGTLEMLHHMGIDDPASLVSLRYRGNGWPGKATAVFRTRNGEETRELTYEQSWGDVLSKYRPWRCKLCADHTGEFADIAVGDPWYISLEEGTPGLSLIIARTIRGMEFIEAASSAGHLKIREVDARVLAGMHPNPRKTKGMVWGRVLASRMMGVPAPRYTNMPMLRFWWRDLTLLEKMRSIFGTMRRIVARASKPQN